MSVGAQTLKQQDNSDQRIKETDGVPKDCQSQ